ncbi:MAG: penicillin acylase family protein [Desulfosalsimonadaceae bacterium]
MKPGRWIRVVLSFLLLASAAGVASAESTVETTRDDKGVWFITGDESASLYDVFEAMGYAVATDRLWQAENFRRAARGRLAELFGADYLNDDILVRVTGYTDAELTAGYDALDSEAKDMVDGYVAGFNRRIDEVAQNPAQLPFEFHALTQQLGLEEIFVPEYWTAEDVMAWQAAMLRNFDPEATKQGQLDNAALLQYLTTVYGEIQGMVMFNDLRWTNDRAATTYIPDPAGTSAGGEPAMQEMPVHDADRADLAGLRSMGDLSGVARNVEGMWADREENLKKLNAFAEMGSYAWTISGDKTASGNPILYSGPQMGFSAPAICAEGSIDAGGIRVSGMVIPGLPGIVIGRTPHHAWSMQVGHARTLDYYFEPAPGQAPEGYYTSRMETFQVAGQEPVTIPVYRTPNGPVVNPMPFDPDTYVPDAQNPIVSWKYAHWGMELQTISAFLEMTRAKSMDAFGASLEDVGVSQHFCYADRNGNIAYWMSGVDPVRQDFNADGKRVDWRLPQGTLVDPVQWSAENRKPLSTDRNTDQGFYAGWNNKSSVEYPNSANNMSYFFGPFHRAHVLEAYLSVNDDLTFEEIRDLALNIATTDSFGSGGNPWAFVEDDFRGAVLADPTEDRLAALDIMDDFDGHFVDGGPENWADGMDRSDGWMLADAWIREVLRLTFVDELAGSVQYDAEEEELKNPTVLFNVLLHGLAGEGSSVIKNYNWFQNNADPEAPQTAEEIILGALDNVLAAQLPLNERPWGVGKRDVIEFNHPFFSEPPLALNPLHTMPFSSRSTFAHVVEMTEDGQARIESMFALGQSGTILADVSGMPVFDENFSSMTEVYDDFSHRDFRVRKAAAIDDDEDEDEDDDDDDSSTCFIGSLLR